VALARSFNSEHTYGWLSQIYQTSYSGGIVTEILKPSACSIKLLIVPRVAKIVQKALESVYATMSLNRYTGYSDYGPKFLYHKVVVTSRSVSHIPR
jgi:hypothetical protein